MVVIQRIPFVFILHSLISVFSNKFIPGADSQYASLYTSEGPTDCRYCKTLSKSVELSITESRRLTNDKQALQKSIKNGLCVDADTDLEKNECRSMYFNNTNAIDEWIDKQLPKNVRLFDYLCINKLKLCCPLGRYGPTCSNICPECRFNEYCHGDGLRSGEGHCSCLPGYTDVNCSKCEIGYFKVNRGTKDPVAICEKCHKSCRYCRSGGPMGCEVCQTGFTFQKGYGCIDVDECLRGPDKVCGTNTFCVNTEGSYFCYQCDRACDGCHGDGPDMCLNCATDFKLVDGSCVDQSPKLVVEKANYIRYLLYLSLCACTCIIFYSDIYIASFIGLLVALYIGSAEYVMHTNLIVPPDAALAPETRISNHEL